MQDGVIDLTDAAEKMKATFVIAAHKYLVGLAATAPGVGPFAAWVVNNILSYFIKWNLEKLSNWSLMQAFFLNTVHRKAKQASEYIEAVNEKNKLPPGASKDVYEAFEQKELRAFDNLVLLIK
jgi:hypothetical protein